MFFLCVIILIFTVKVFTPIFDFNMDYMYIIMSRSIHYCFSIYPQHSALRKKQKMNLRANELMKFFQDIDDPIDDPNEGYNKLSTNLRWSEDNESELLSRSKIIKKYLSGFTNLTSIKYAADMIMSDMPVKDLKLLINFDATESLKIALQSVKLEKIDHDTFSKICLSQESKTLFSNLFWYLFILYFKSTAKYKKLLKNVSSELCQNYISLKYSELICNLKNYRSSKIIDNKKLINKTYTDYFFDSYPFILGESIYISFIRHFCGNDEWIINYRIRNKMISDIFELLNGIEISHICLNKHLHLLYPNGTLIPSPILWRKNTINYNLRIATTPRMHNNDRSTLNIKSNHRAQSVIMAGDRNRRSKLEFNPKRMLSTAPNNNNNMNLNINTPHNNKYPLKIWLNQQILLRNQKLENQPRKIVFLSRKLSPLYKNMLSSSTMRRGQSFTMHHVTPFCKIGGSDTIVPFVDSKLNKKIVNIQHQTQICRKRIQAQIHLSSISSSNSANNNKKTSNNDDDNNKTKSNNNDVNVDRIFSTNFAKMTLQKDTLKTVD